MHKKDVYTKSYWEFRDNNDYISDTFNDFSKNFCYKSYKIFQEY